MQLNVIISNFMSIKFSQLSLKFTLLNHVSDARQRMGGVYAGDPAAKRGQKKHYGFSRNLPPSCQTRITASKNNTEAAVRGRSGPDKA